MTRLRGWILRVLVVVVAAGGLYFLAVTQDDEQEDPRLAHEWPVPDLSGQILFHSHGVLWARESDVDEPHEVGSGPSIRPLDAHQVVAAQGAARLAFVVLRADRIPEVRVFDFDSGRDTVVSRGLQPMWHGSGTKLAFLRPTDPESCEELECPGEVEIVLAEPTTATISSATEPGDYELIGWSGDLVLVADRDDPTATLTVSSNGEVGTLDLEPDEIGDASPDGLWIVAGAEEGERPRLLSASGGEVLDSTPIELRGERAEGERVEVEEATASLGWALGSSRMALEVVVGEDRRLAIGSPHEAEASVVPDSSGMRGEMEERSFVWAPDDLSFVYQRERGGAFETVHCPEPGSQDCTVVLRSSRPVSLLALY